MNRTTVWRSLVAGFLLVGAGGCAPVEFSIPHTLQMQIDLPPPPVPDATVVMTNSKGEVVFQGKTDARGTAQGTRGPGQVDRLLTVTATTPDGKTFTKQIDIWQGAVLEYIHLNVLNGEFSTRFRYPPPRRNGDRDDEKH